MNKSEEIFKAKLAWEANDHGQAIKILERINELTPSESVVEVLIHFYVAEKHFKEALDLIDNQNQNFLKNPTICKAYLEGLLATNRFILARKLVNSLQPDSQLALKCKTMVDEAEQSYIKEAPESVNEAERAFYHIGNNSLGEQQELIRQSYCLPLSNFVRAAKFNLIDPYLNQLTRISILKDLFLIGMEQSVSFIWIDHEQYEVELKNFNDSLWREIEKEFEKENDPVQADLILQQAHLIYELAFPFPERIFPNAQEWVEALKRHFEDGIEIKEFKLINKIIQSIN